MKICRFFVLSIFLLVRPVVLAQSSQADKLDSLMKVKHEAGEFNGTVYSEVFDGTQPKMSGRARGHTKSGEPNDYHALTTGAGGIYSQVDDLFLWDQALYNDHLVKNETLNQAFTPALLANGEPSYYGFGWVLEAKNPKVVQHSGSLAGFRTFFYRDTGNKNTIILLSNFTNDVSSIKEEIANALYFFQHRKPPFNHPVVFQLT